ncbi:MAG: diacylglycerol kinase [Desulfobulbaceae bacterium]|nr:diacylglycerol kinase [Desulfobulbaceae bacterium]
MHKRSVTGVRRVVNAMGYSLRGLQTAWRNEAAFRQELWLMLVLVPLGIWLGESPAQRVLFTLPCFLVLISELFNSAIEAVVDRIGPEHHELSGAAKDIGSAAVFISLAAVIFVWLLLLLPRFVR